MQDSASDMTPTSKGKIALVTGANSGLGKGTATGLAKWSAAVVMVCRDAEQGEVTFEFTVDTPKGLILTGIE